MRDEPVRRGILAVDVEGYGRLERTNPHRTRLRRGLHQLLQLVGLRPAVDAEPRVAS